MLVSCQSLGGHREHAHAYQAFIPLHDDTLQICEYSWAAPWREGLGQICQCGDMNSDDCEMTHDICEAAGTGIQTLHDCYQLMMTIAGAAETSEDQ